MPFGRSNKKRDYSPDNCRVATRIENANNKSNNVFVEAFGERKTIAQWRRDSRCSVSYYTLRNRFQNTSMTAEEAITRPVHTCA